MGAPILLVVVQRSWWSPCLLVVAQRSWWSPGAEYEDYSMVPWHTLVQNKNFNFSIEPLPPLQGQDTPPKIRERPRSRGDV